ncbi:MAG: Asp-tRNA(Asn)/Glu-tRNA(Gln) amidotransferase subunit GatC [Planctomycetes bacterium]|nr:Asp-tRNA(Asn)/Glu-tRNA(Gln) amidotransferase subunit GatC [Planctomycetota bacterium]
MGHITSEDVKKIAHLSRLDLSEEEIALFSEQLESILDYIEKLSEVDIEGIEPFMNAAAEGNVFREDEIRESLSTDEALSNAPQKGGGFFKVPEVIQ